MLRKIRLLVSCEVTDIDRLRDVITTMGHEIEVDSHDGHRTWTVLVRSDGLPREKIACAEQAIADALSKASSLHRGPSVFPVAS